MPKQHLTDSKMTKIKREIARKLSHNEKREMLLNRRRAKKEFRRRHPELFKNRKIIEQKLSIFEALHRACPNPRTANEIYKFIKVLRAELETIDKQLMKAGFI